MYATPQVWSINLEITKEAFLSASKRDVPRLFPLGLTKKSTNICTITAIPALAFEIQDNIKEQLGAVDVWISEEFKYVTRRRRELGIALIGKRTADYFVPCSVNARQMLQQV